MKSEKKPKTREAVFHPEFREDLRFWAETNRKTLLRAKVVYYRNSKGESPVDGFLKSLSPKQFEKVVWVLAIIRDLPFISNQYLKKLRGTDGIWEVRIDAGNDTFRLLGFF